jgi:O-antigen/teichoic acid export membrane protein
VAPAPERLRRLLSHGAIYTLGTLLSRLVAFVMLPIYTRALHPEDYGIIELLDTADRVALVLFATAINGAVLRFYQTATDDRDKAAVLSTAVVALTALGALVGVLGWLAAPGLAEPLLHDPRRALLLQLTLCSAVFDAVIEVPFAWLRANGRPGVFVACSLAWLLLGLGANVVLVVLLERGALGVVISWIFSTGLLALGMTAAMLRQTGLSFSASLLRRMLAFGWPLVPGALSELALGRARSYVLAAYCTLDEVGLWALALKFGSTVSLLVGLAFTQAWSAEQYEVWRRPDGRKIFARVGTLLAFVLLFSAAGLSLLSREVILTMAAPEFAAAWALIPALALAAVLRELGDFLRSGLLAAGDTGPIAWIEPGVCVLDVALSVLLIGALGLHGALLAAPLVHLGYLLSIAWVVAHRIGLELERGPVLALFGLAIATVGLGLGLAGAPFGLQLAFRAALLVAFPAAALLLVFRRAEERALVGSLFGGRGAAGRPPT